MLQSSSLILGPFASTASPWTFGNQHICSFDGVLFVVGMTCVPYFSTTLAMYYYCKLYKNMTEDEILHKVEKKMHMFIFPFVLIMNIYAVVANAINSAISGTVCTYATTPTGCKLNDDVVCDENLIPALILNIITVFIIPFASLAIIVSILSFLLWKIVWQELILPPYSSQSKTRTLSANIPNEEEQGEQQVRVPFYRHIMNFYEAKFTHQPHIIMQRQHLPPHLQFGKHCVKIEAKDSTFLQTPTRKK